MRLACSATVCRSRRSDAHCATSSNRIRDIPRATSGIARRNDSSGGIGAHGSTCVLDRRRARIHGACRVGCHGRLARTMGDAPQTARVCAERVVTGVSAQSESEAGKPRSAAERHRTACAGRYWLPSGSSPDALSNWKTFQFTPLPSEGAVACTHGGAGSTPADGSSRIATPCCRDGRGGRLQRVPPTRRL